MAVEAVAGVAEQADGLQQIVGNHRHKHIQLEIARSAGDADGGVVAQHLRGHHGERFALGGVDLARHDRRARFVFGNAQFAQAAARAAGEPADIVGDFVEARGQGFECAAGKHGGIAGGERLEFIGRAHKRQAG